MRKSAGGSRHGACAQRRSCPTNPAMRLGSGKVASDLHPYRKDQNPRRPPMLHLPRIWVRLGGLPGTWIWPQGEPPKTFYPNFAWAPGLSLLHSGCYLLLPAPVCLLYHLGSTYHAAYRGRASQPWSPEPGGTRLGGLPSCTLPSCTLPLCTWPLCTWPRPAMR